MRLMRTLLGSLPAIAVLIAPSPSNAAAGKVNVVGSVSNLAGEPVPGASVELLSAGEVVGGAVTSASGGYTIPCVAPGRYEIRLDPRTPGVHGETFVAPVGDDGLLVKWTVGGDQPALAAAVGGGGTCNESTIGAAPAAPAAAAGVPAAAAIGVGGAVVVGGTLGGLAASGSFDGSDTTSSTPSQ